MINRFVIAKNVYKLILEIIINESAIERVGLLFGVINRNKVHIEDFEETKNLDNSPISFTLDTEHLIRKIQIYEGKKKQLLGFFHTHPKGTKVFPSLKDSYYMRNWPYPYIWMVGGKTKEVEIQIFTLKDDQILKLEYTVK